MTTLRRSCAWAGILALAATARWLRAVPWQMWREAGLGAGGSCHRQKAASRHGYALLRPLFVHPASLHAPPGAAPSCPRSVASAADASRVDRNALELVDNV